MNPDEQALLDLAARVSDGSEIDWPSAEARARDDEGRKIVRHLRLVESLAHVHRSVAIPGAVRDPASLTATIDPTTLFRKPEPSEVPPAQWGHLRLLERIGGGAFGEVYRAWDDKLQLEVALKLLERSPAGAGDRIERFLREARLLARVKHPNVIAVHGADIHEGRVGIWMELVRGRTLAQLMQDQGRMGAREATLVGLDLCRALAAVHGAGLVHRDVKAQNVMRAEGGHLRLMDFGSTSDLPEPGDRLSGTPLYMAPETVIERTATERSDLYSLGVLLFHLVSGAYPVEGGSLDELIEAHRVGRVRLLRDLRADLPEGFVSVVERALSRDPAQRFASAGEMERALTATLGIDSSAPARQGTEQGKGWRLGRATLVAASLALAFAIGVIAWRGPSSEYDVSAVVYGQRGEAGKAEALQSGDTLAIGDRIALDLQASRQLHVYVFSEDDLGNAYCLFPLPESSLRNPLAAGTRHWLPSSGDGTKTWWAITTAAEREHLVVLGSPERLVEFEAELALLPRPRFDAKAVALPPEVKQRLMRGIGGLVETPAPQPPGARATNLFELAHELAGTEEKTRGVWLRQIEFLYPAR